MEAEDPVEPSEGPRLTSAKLSPPGRGTRVAAPEGTEAAHRDLGAARHGPVIHLAQHGGKADRRLQAEAIADHPRGLGGPPLGRWNRAGRLDGSGAGGALGIGEAFGKKSLAAAALEQAETVHLGLPVADEVDRQVYSRGMGHALPQEQPPST